MVEFGCFTWNVNIEVSFGCSASGHGGGGVPPN